MLCIPLHSAHDGLGCVYAQQCTPLVFQALTLCSISLRTVRMHTQVVLGTFTLELKCVYAHLFCSLVSLYAQCSVLYLACKQYLLLTLCLHTIFISSEFMYVSTFGLVVRRECAYTSQLLIITYCFLFSKSFKFLAFFFIFPSLDTLKGLPPCPHILNWFSPLSTLA